MDRQLFADAADAASSGSFSKAIYNPAWFERPEAHPSTKYTFFGIGCTFPAYPADPCIAMLMHLCSAVGTGSSFHSHPAAWNALLRGTKQWMVAPPTVTAPVVDRPIASWCQLLTVTAAGS